MYPSDPQLAPLLADLNEQQRAAVMHRDGPLLVVAGPGSGKTRVITRRAAYLVHTGVPPFNVLAVTFTNKATEEMRHRLAELGVGHGMWVYTFHALGARLLREFGELASVEPGFSIYDEADALRVVKDAYEQTDVSSSYLRPEAARAWISNAKNQLWLPDQAAEQASGSRQLAAAEIYRRYQLLLEDRNAVDFDDLLMRVALVLRDQPEITQRLNERFQFLLVDEYQDTNHAQYLIARFLSQHHSNICATGDPDQSIYGWRGADLNNILDFERDYPSAKVVRLEQNYRSTGHVLRVADRLIQNNSQRKHKELWTDQGLGEPVSLWRFARGDDEAEAIASEILAERARGRTFSDFAVFYRVNALSRGIEDALRKRHIPYRIVRGVEFYNRREIRDMLAYLRVLVNPADTVALLRIINTPTRGIGKTTIARLQTLAAESDHSVDEVVCDAQARAALGNAAKRVAAFAELIVGLRARLDEPPSNVLAAILKHSGLEDELKQDREVAGEDRLANVEELITVARTFENEPTNIDRSVVGFLHQVSLASDQDAVDEHAGQVLLMTLHAAKGLEFPVVFLIGLEQGLLPHERALDVLNNTVEEERRLCFVGITRARERLILTHSAERYTRGRRMPKATSQFVYELDQGDLQTRDHQSPTGNTGRHPGLDENFVPLVDDLPPEEAARLVPRRRLREHPPTDDEYMDEPVSEFRSRRPRPPAPPATDSTETPFANWIPGTLVQHDQYGPGQVTWIRPAPGQTRAGIKFVSRGEVTLILEHAPVRKLERR